VNPPTPSIDEVFFAAMERESPEARAAYLDEVCGSDLDLRRRVERLLDAQPKVGSFLDSPAAGPTMTRPPPQVMEGPGTVIGPYKLLERIGEGGMGIVYMAEQTRPVRRKVALKIIKPGMDSRQVIARFEAERQALAMMDHHNIAKVFDAGSTESGRPYFVMELVRGIPITEYCDQHRLPIPERLNLFMQVCQAVQHAHQKGIIHRDIKPTNVLVTSLDGVPLPRVIDFGIAKATGQSLTDKTLFTGFAHLIGTPLYMSPEQAELSAVDIDTRSDIYSLGVLLYELLTGTTPFSQDTFRTAALDEVRRIIREDEPPKPSTRISALGATLTTVSANRQTDARKLNRSLRGELDWIVMKSLEKDRRRRYETASGLARDVERYLAGDPVEAGPPSGWYRLSKFARRNRVVLTTTVLVALALIAGTTVSAWQAILARRARADAVQQRERTRVQFELASAARGAEARAREQAEAVSRFLVDAFRRADPDSDGRELKVVELLTSAAARLDTEFAGSPKIKGELLDAIGVTLDKLGLSVQAAEILEKALAGRQAALGPNHNGTLATENSLGEACLRAGRTARAFALFQAVLKARESTLGPDHNDTLECQSNIAMALAKTGDLTKAIPLFERTLRARKSKLGINHYDTLTTQNDLASTLADAGRNEEALALFEATLKGYEATLGPDHTATLRGRNNLAFALTRVGRSPEAIPLLETTLKQRESKLGPDHPHTANSLMNLAVAYGNAHDPVRAMPLVKRALEVKSRRLGPDNPETLAAQIFLGRLYQQTGHPAEAARLLEDAARRARGRPDAIKLAEEVAREIQAAYYDSGQYAKSEPYARELLAKSRTSYGRESRHPVSWMFGLGLVLLKQQKWSEAEPILREALEVLQKTVPDAWATFAGRSALGDSLLGMGQYAGAEPLIVSGYEGLKARAATIPRQYKSRLTEAAERVVRLYKILNQPGKAESMLRKEDLDAMMPNGAAAFAPRSADGKEEHTPPRSKP